MSRLNNLCAILLVVFLGSLYQGAILPFISGIKYGIAVANYQIDSSQETEFFARLDVDPKDENYMDFSEVNMLTGERMLTRPVAFSVVVNSVPEKTLWMHILETLYFIFTVITLFLCIWVSVLVITILRSLRYSGVFKRRNLDRINRIGIMVVGIGICGSIVRLIHVLIANQLVDLTHYTFSLANVFNFNAVLIGIIILIMNEVLRIAIALKGEQELTI